MVYQRATVLIENSGYLVGREKTSRKYSLPGGRINRGESPLQAAKRELWEEFHLTGHSWQELFEHSDQYRDHTVFFTIVDDQTLDRLQRPELIGAGFYRPKEDTPSPNLPRHNLERHVAEILEIFSEDGHEREVNYRGLGSSNINYDWKHNPIFSHWMDVWEGLIAQENAGGYPLEKLWKTAELITLKSL